MRAGPPWSDILIAFSRVRNNMKIELTLGIDLSFHLDDSDLASTERLRFQNSNSGNVFAIAWGCNSVDGLDVHGARLR